jgi:hypothetical protein
MIVKGDERGRKRGKRGRGIRKSNRGVEYNQTT